VGENWSAKLDFLGNYNKFVKDKIEVKKTRFYFV
jgi:hypothetical protein